MGEGGNAMQTIGQVAGVASSLAGASQPAANPMMPQATPLVGQPVTSGGMSPLMGPPVPQGGSQGGPVLPNFPGFQLTGGGGGHGGPKIDPGASKSNASVDSGQGAAQALGTIASLAALVAMFV